MEHTCIIIIKIFYRDRRAPDTSRGVLICEWNNFKVRESCMNISLISLPGITLSNCNTWVITVEIKRHVYKREYNREVQVVYSGIDVTWIDDLQTNWMVIDFLVSFLKQQLHPFLNFCSCSVTDLFLRFYQLKKPMRRGSLEFTKLIVLAYSILAYLVDIALAITRLWPFVRRISDWQISWAALLVLFG